MAKFYIVLNDLDVAGEMVPVYASDYATARSYADRAYGKEGWKLLFEGKDRRWLLSKRSDCSAQKPQKELASVVVEGYVLTSAEKRSITATKQPAVFEGMKTAQTAENEEIEKLHSQELLKIVDRWVNEANNESTDIYQDAYLLATALKETNEEKFRTLIDLLYKSYESFKAAGETVKQVFLLLKGPGIKVKNEERIAKCVYCSTAGVIETKMMAIGKNLYRVKCDCPYCSVHPKTTWLEDEEEVIKDWNQRMRGKKL